MAIYPGDKEVDSYLGYNSFKIKAGGDLPPNANIKWTFTDGMVIEGKVSQYKEIQRRFCEPGEFGVTCESEGLNDQKFLEIEDGGIKVPHDRWGLYGILNLKDFFVLYNNDDYSYYYRPDYLEFACIKEDLKKESERLLITLNREEMIPADLLYMNVYGHVSVDLVDIFPCSDDDMSFCCIASLYKDQYKEPNGSSLDGTSLTKITINEDFTDYIVSGCKELKFDEKSLSVRNVAYTSDTVYMRCKKQVTGSTDDYRCFYFDINNSDVVSVLMDGDKQADCERIISNNKDIAICTYWEQKSPRSLGYFVNKDKVNPFVSCFNGDIKLIEIDSNFYITSSYFYYNDYLTLINIENRQLTELSITIDGDIDYLNLNRVGNFIKNNDIVGHFEGPTNHMLARMSFDLNEETLTISGDSPIVGLRTLPATDSWGDELENWITSIAPFKYNNGNCYIISYASEPIPDSIPYFQESRIYIPYRSEE